MSAPFGCPQPNRARRNSAWAQRRPIAAEVVVKNFDRLGAPLSAAATDRAKVITMFDLQLMPEVEPWIPSAMYWPAILPFVVRVGRLV